MELGKKKKSIIQNARVDGHKGKTFLLAGGNETDTFLRTITNDRSRPGGLTRIWRGCAILTQQGSGESTARWRKTEFNKVLRHI